MRREGLLAAIRGRIEHSDRHRDVRILLDPQAIQEAAALMEMVAEPDRSGRGVDLEALHTVGWLHWLRYMALPEGQDQDDLQAALTLLAPVFAADASAVPPELREVYLHEGMDEAASPSEAAAAARAGVAGTAPDDPALPGLLNNLSVDLRKLFERTGDRAVLAEAADAARSAIRTARHGDPVKILSSVNLCIALQISFDTFGDIDALAEAVSVGRAAVTAASSLDDQTLRAGCSSVLSLALLSQYRHTGALATLQEAVGESRAALGLTPADDPNRLADLTGLGIMLQTLYLRTGDRATLIEGLEVGRQALDATPDGHPVRPGQLSNRCGMLQAAYLDDGDVRNLTEAVAAGRAAVAAAPLDHPDRPRFLSNLGNALRTMYISTGDLESLSEAVAIQRSAVSATPRDYPERVTRLTNLCGTLAILAERTDDRQALAEAVEVARAAVSDAPKDHPNRIGYIANLCGVLNDSAKHTGEAAPLAEAIALGRAALTSAPHDNLDRAAALTNLFTSLGMQFERTGEARTLAEALDIGRRAGSALPRAHPDWASNQSSLGRLLVDAYQRFGDPALLAQARDLFAQAAGSASAPVLQRVMAGRALASAHQDAGDQRAALAALEEVVGLLPRLAARDLRRADREYRLGQVAGTGAHAAAAALSMGLPDRAVELLEQARGLLLAETMGSRNEPALLRELAPDLADEFERLRDRLASVEMRRSAISGNTLTTPDDAPNGADPGNPRQREALSLGELTRDGNRQWEELLARIRGRPGLAGFLAPLPARELQKRAGRWPIVIINTTVERCDALIVTADPDAPIRHIPLPDLTQQDVTRQADRFRQARSAATRDLGRVAHDRAAPPDLMEILAWLWDTTAGPILDGLGYTGPPEPGQEWPRVWWCPVGTMAYLPLHAAGHHTEVAGRMAAPRTVLDRVMSSYTSTIMALAYSRTAPTAGPAHPLLVVAMPETPAAGDLPGVAAECSMLTTLVPTATVLQGAEATQATVLAALHQHAIAHFACHGRSDWADPAANRLLLHDHASDPLTVDNVSREHLKGARLAYLSACSTTDTSPRLADEAIHITSAFQLAGYRNVIGTLWPVDDDAATRIATEVYTELTDRGSHAPRADDAASALHHALRQLRADRLAAPALWASHIHIGA